MKAEISMPKMMRSITIQAVVTGERRTRLRIWLGSKIMMIAAAVMGCNVEVDIQA
jgi:hypothetical protein